MNCFLSSQLDLMGFACDRPTFTVMSHPGKQLECLFFCWSTLLSTSKSLLEEFIVAGKFASGSEGINSAKEVVCLLFWVPLTIIAL